MCVYIALTVVLSMLVQEGTGCLAKIDNKEGDGQVQSLSFQVFLFIQFSSLWSSTPGDVF